MKLIIAKFSTSPKQLFLIDGCGAVVTAFLLVAILAGFESAFGMPQSVLYALASVACIYAIYSFCCYSFVSNNWLPWLQAIAIANTVYCCLTLGLVVYFYHDLTVLGIAYFLLEVILIGGLVYIEFKVSAGVSGRA